MSKLSVSMIEGLGEAQRYADRLLRRGLPPAMHWFITERHENANVYIHHQTARALKKRGLFDCRSIGGYYDEYRINDAGRTEFARAVKARHRLKKEDDWDDEEYHPIGPLRLHLFDD